MSVANSTSRKLIVTALYDYQGSDDNSLSFTAGDVIRVLNQLESGWWNGICRGQRGWFPSNYVSVPATIATSDLNKDEETMPNDTGAPEAKRQSKQPPQTPMSAQSESSTFSFSKAMASLNIDQVFFISDTLQALPNNWTQKVSNDGKVYFLNSMTGETTWSIENINPETGQVVCCNLNGRLFTMKCLHRKGHQSHLQQHLSLHGTAYQMIL